MSVRVRERGGKVRGAPLSQLGLPPSDQKLEVGTAWEQG